MAEEFFSAIRCLVDTLMIPFGQFQILGEILVRRRATLTLLILFLIFTSSTSAVSAAKLSVAQKECVHILFSRSKAEAVIKSGRIPASKLNAVNSCVKRVKKFPQSQISKLSGDYGISKKSVSQTRIKYLNGSISVAQIRTELLSAAIVLHPGLAGYVTGTQTPRAFLEYYVAAVTRGLEIVDSSIDPFNDPLFAIWLQSGFPQNKQELKVAIMNDTRYSYTYRANLEAIAFGQAFACAFGVQSACDSQASTRLQLAALGPLVL
jgi:hypothetical protein